MSLLISSTNFDRSLLPAFRNCPDEYVSCTSINSVTFGNDWAMEKMKVSLFITSSEINFGHRETIKSNTNFLSLLPRTVVLPLGLLLVKSTRSGTSLFCAIKGGSTAGVGFACRSLVESVSD